MSKRMIRTISDFVEEMGGTGSTARWLGVTDSYVSNMLSRGYLPDGFNMRALAELRRRGRGIHPDFFDLKSDDAAVLADVLRPSPSASKDANPVA